MTTKYEVDSVSILVPVTDEGADGPLDLTGADLSAHAGRVSSEAIAGTAEVVGSAANGNIAVTFDEGAFLGRVGRHECHVVVTKDGETQTVAVVEFDIERSYRATGAD